MKTVLVTGGNGFIGHHLCEKLLQRGNHVISIDNFCSSNRQKVEMLSEYSNFEFIEHDIVVPFKTTDKIDEIYHLACPASPPKYQKDPIFTLETCTKGVQNCLDLSVEKQAKILLTSTSEVYGEPLVHPQHEAYRGNVNTVGPRACYDEGKRISETYFYEYHQCHGVKIKIARLFNTYGPGMDPEDGRVISNLIVSAISGNVFPIYGTGHQTRSFCYVSDMVRGLIALMDSDDSVTGPINLGNPIELSIIDLATKISKIANTDIVFDFHDLPVDDPSKRRPDITEAAEKLNWQPEVPVDEGLFLTWQYYNQKFTCN